MHCMQANAYHREESQDELSCYGSALLGFTIIAYHSLLYLLVSSLLLTGCGQVALKKVVDQ